MLLYAGKEGEDDDIGVDSCVGYHGFCKVGAENVSLMIVDIYAGIAKVGIVEWVESIETFCILFRRTVAAQKSAIEIDADFGHDGRAVIVMGGSNLDACNKVFFAVGAQLSHGQLASGQNNGLGQILQQERQHRGRVRHGVGSVKDDEAVVQVVTLGNNPY